jgi:hypothetical protein
LVDDFSLKLTNNADDKRQNMLYERHSKKGTVRREGLVSFARITPELLISYDILVLLS